MSRGPEGRVEDYLRDYFKQRGWLVYKMDQGGGVADRLLISPKGFHLWVELKKPGKGTLDPAQVAWAKDIRNRLFAHDDGQIRLKSISVVGPINSHEGVRALHGCFKDL